MISYLKPSKVVCAQPSAETLSPSLLPELPSAKVAFHSLQATERSSPLLRVWKANCHTKKCLFLKTQWKVFTQPGLPWDLCSPPVMWQEEQTKECKAPRSPFPPQVPQDSPAPEKAPCHLSDTCACAISGKSLHAGRSGVEIPLCIITRSKAAMFSVPGCNTVVL